MRPAMVVLALLLAACRRDAATGTVSRGEGRAAKAVRTTFTDDELVAFARWQRDSVDLFRQHKAELDAAGSADPDLFMRDPRAFEAQVAEVAARHAPVMKAMQDRAPFTGRTAELVAEAVGGLFHFDRNSEIAIGRDEIRLEAARRRFGAKPIDDIVAREALILAALRNP